MRGIQAKCALRAIGSGVLAALAISAGVAGFDAAQAAAAPPNDNFADAIELSAAHPSHTGTTAGATAEPGEPWAAPVGSYRSVWYRFTSPTERRITIGACATASATSYWTYLGVYRGTSVDALTSVDYTSDQLACGRGSAITFLAQSGVEYRIPVAGYEVFAGTEDFVIALDPRPANDDRAKPFGLTSTPFGAFGVSGGTRAATKESGEPDHAGDPGGKSVWFNAYLPAAGRTLIEACGSTFDTTLGVYRPGGTTALASNDDTAGCGPGGKASLVRFTPDAPGNVEIAIDGHGGASGDARISLLTNDDRAGAAVVYAPGGGTYDNTWATAEAGERAHAGHPASRSVWLRLDGLTVGARAQLRACPESPELDTVLAVYRQAPDGSLTEIAANDDQAGACGLESSGSAVSFVAPTESVLVAADTKGARGGRISVVSQAAPPNDDRARAQPLTQGSIFAYPTLVLAGREEGEPEHAGNPGGHSVWYRLEPTSSSAVGLNAQACGFSPLLAVYTEEDGELREVTSDGPPASSSSTCTTAVVSFQAQVGTAYYVAVDGRDGAAGPVSLTGASSPPNDAFASAYSLFGSVSGTTALATSEPGEPEHDGTPAAHSVWYRLTTFSAQRQTLSTCEHATADLRIAVYEGTSLGSLTPVTSGGPTIGCALGRGARVSWTPPDAGLRTYWIAVDDAGLGSASFTLSQETAPTNDARANATTVYENYTTSGSTRFATREPDEPDHAGAGGQSSVWYRWTPARAAAARVDTCSSLVTQPHDTVLAVYRERDGALEEVAANDDTATCAGGTGSRVSFDAAQYATYYIAVDAKPGSHAQFILALRMRPANDDRADAETITQDTWATTRLAFLDLATKEAGEPAHAGNPGGHSVWYRWAPPSGGLKTIDTCGYGIDTLLAVYVERDGALEQVAANDDSPRCAAPGVGSSVSFEATVGQAYFVAVDGKDGAVGSTQVNFPPVHDNFSGAVALTFSVSGNLHLATAEDAEPAHAGAPARQSVWHTWTPSRNALATIDTCGDAGTRVAVYAGNSLATLTPVTARAGSACPDGKGGRVRFDAASDTAYRVAVDAEATTSYAPYTLEARLAPHNDQISESASLGSSAAGSAIGTTADAGLEEGEPDHAEAGGIASVWYRWTAPRSATVRFDTCSSATFDTAVALYAAEPDGTLGALVGANDDAAGCGGGKASRVRAHVDAGKQYLVAVTGHGDAEGTFTLTRAMGPANDDFAGAAALSSSSSGVSGTLADAGDQIGEPDHGDLGGDHSVWYRFSVGDPRNVEVRVCVAAGAAVPAVAVYSGTALPDLLPAGTPSTQTIGGQDCRIVALRGMTGQRHIAVDGGAPGAEGTFSIRLAVAQPNDDRERATDLFGRSTTGTTFAATSEAGEPSHAGNVGGRSVWFRFTATADGPVTFETCGPGLDSLLALYTDDGGTLTEVAANDDAAACGTGGSRVRPTLTAGTTYLIAVDGKHGAEGSFVLRLSPANDLFAEPIERADELWTSSTSTERAGDEPGEPAHNGRPAARSVWYSWTPPRGGRAQLSTCLASATPTTIAVYTGAAIGALTPVGSGGPTAGCADGAGALLRLRVTAGETYRIAVDAATAGTFTLQAALTPANDDRVDAIDVTLNETVLASTAFATPEDGESVHAGRAAQASVWYRLTPSTAGRVRLKSCGSSFATTLAVYRAAGLTEVASADDEPGRCADRAAVEFDAQAGTAYLIAVDGHGGATGALRLAVGAPANDHVQDAAVIGSTPASAEVNVDAATPQAADPWPLTNGGSVWWSWTPTASGPVEINTCGSGSSTTLAVFHGDIGALVRDAWGDWSAGCNGRSRVTLDAVAGRRYLIAVAGAYGDVRLQINPPDNDRFEGAKLLEGIETEATGTTKGASTEDGEPNHHDDGQRRTLWYTWTATGSGRLTLDGCSSPTPMYVELYQGSAVTSLGRVPDDGADRPCEGKTSRTFVVDEGESYVIAVDGLGATPGETLLRLLLATDNVPPETTIDEGPERLTNEAQYRFAFSSDDPEATFECALDDEAFAACTPPVQRGPLSDGEHTFTVRAIDTAQNPDPTPATWMFAVDRTPPPVSIDAGPPALGNQRDASFEFSSSDPEAGFECRLDTAEFDVCSSPAKHQDLADGPHTWGVRATDPAGNTTDASHAFTVDTTPPTTSVSEAPDDPTNAAVPRLVFGSEQDAAFACSLDGSEFTACTSPWNMEWLAEGSHMALVRATDSAGNVEDPAVQRSFTIDRTAPETSITAGPDEPVRTVASFELAADEEARFECRVDDGEEWQSCDSAHEVRTRGMRPGVHTLRARAIDRAGNVDDTEATRTFAVINDPPSATLDVSPDHGFRALEVGATVGGSDPEGDGLTFKLTFGDGSGAVTGALPSGARSHTYTRSGTFQVRLEVTDGASTDVRTRVVTVAEPEPLRADAGDDRIVTVGERVDFDGGASRPDGLIERYRWNFGDGETGTGRSASHVYAEPGMFTARLTTTRGGETDTDEARVVVRAPTPGGLRVRVRGGGNALPGANALIVRPDGTRQSATAGALGIATITDPPDGASTVYVWADGFQPKAVKAAVARGDGEVDVELDSGAAGATTLSSRRMTYDEILEAGIDPADPDNSHVYEAKIHLYFGEEPVEPIRVIITREGLRCVGECGGGTGGGGGGGGGGGAACHNADSLIGCWVLNGHQFLPEITYVDDKPVIHWLVLPIRASFLKEFFNVQLVVQNVLAGLTFSPGVASLKVPPGLSLAPLPTPQTPEQEVSAVPGGEARSVSWIVRGDVEGEYDLAAEYSATIEPIGQQVYLTASTREPLHVWGAGALRTRILVDPSAVRWGPYTVDIEVTNITDGSDDPAPVYNMQVEMLDGPENPPPDQASFFYAPEPPQVQGTDEIAPGQKVVFSYTVFPGIGNDEVQRMRLLLSESFIERTGGDVDLEPELGIRTNDDGSDPSSGPRSGTVHVEVQRDGAHDAAHITWARPSAPSGATIAGYGVWSRQQLKTGPWTPVDVPIDTDGDGGSAIIPAEQRALGRYYAIGTRYSDGKVRFEHQIGVGPSRYVSLGDSFSAGEGVPLFEPYTDKGDDHPDAANKCHRSFGSYGRLLAEDPEVNGVLQPATFAACSGAVTADIDIAYKPEQPNAKNPGEPLQMDHVSEFTDVISLSIGGNDIDFKSIGIGCLVPAIDCRLDYASPLGSEAWARRMTDIVTDATEKYLDIKAVKDAISCRPFSVPAALLCLWRIQRASEAFDDLGHDERRVNVAYLFGNVLHDRLVRVYRRLAERAPNARIFVQPYPAIVDESEVPVGCDLLGPGEPSLTQGDRAGIGFVVTKINQEIGRAVNSANSAIGRDVLEVVDIRDEFRGHELCRNGELNPETYYNSAVNPFFGPLANLGPISYAFHPNKFGQQAYARALRDEVNGGINAHLVTVPPRQTVDGGGVFVPWGARRLRAQAAIPGSKVSLSLVAPDGTVHDENTPGVQSDRTPTTHTLVIEDPAQGTWRVRVFGDDVMPAGEPTQITAAATVPPAEPRTVTARATLVSGSTFDLDATGPVGATYRWLLSDGRNADGATVRHEFPDEAELWATLKATTEDGEVLWTTVSVRSSDVLPPVISGVPEDLVVEATGPDGATVTFSAPTATDNRDGEVWVACTHLSGDVFPLGDTTVTCRARDAADNLTIRSFDISVRDTTAPVMSAIPGPLSVSAPPGASGATVSFDAPKAADVVSGARPVTCTPGSGSEFAVGETIVRCEAADEAGNRTEANFRVTVTATAPPGGDPEEPGEPDVPGTAQPPGPGTGPTAPGPLGPLGGGAGGGTGGSPGGPPTTPDRGDTGGSGSGSGTKSDTKGPVVHLRAGTRQKLRSRLRVRAVCPRERCVVRGSASLSLPRSGKTKTRTLRIEASARRLRRNKAAYLTFRISNRNRSRIRRALRARKTVRVVVEVVAEDADGNTRKAKKTIRLRR